MEDEQIITLYWERNEDAISQTEHKYGAYLMQVAYNVLQDREDGQECVNDTYFKAWNAMPPQRPNRLCAFLATSTRQGAIDRYRSRHRLKRREDVYALSLDELDECIPDRNTPEREAEAEELGRIISAYLRTLPERSRQVFLRRYFCMDSMEQLAEHFDMNLGAVKSLLFRTRQGLKKYLEEEAWT